MEMWVSEVWTVLSVGSGQNSDICLFGSAQDGRLTRQNGNGYRDQVETTMGASGGEKRRRVARTDMMYSHGTGQEFSSNTGSGTTGGEEVGQAASISRRRSSEEVAARAPSPQLSQRARRGGKQPQHGQHAQLQHQLPSPRAMMLSDMHYSRDLPYTPDVGHYHQDRTEEAEDDDDDDDDDGHGEGSRPEVRPRKPHLQGRFSGRLETKSDEKKLADECRLLGPMLGGVGKRGERSRLTLAKIVRGIAAGDVRRHCEQRERKLQVGPHSAAP